MKKIAFLLLAFLLIARPKAHNVTWFGNPEGIPWAPLASPPPLSIQIYPEDIFFPDQDIPPFGVIHIEPDFFFPFPVPVPYVEPCTVWVNVDPPDTPLLGIDLVPNDLSGKPPLILFPPITDSEGVHALFPALEYDVIVFLRGFPTNSEPIQTFITGEWHASGQPDTNECTAVKPNGWVVPVEVSFAPRWAILADAASGQVTVDTKKEVGLQVADKVEGPYTTIGQGHLFSFLAESAQQFFRAINRMEGGVLGTINDSAGKPQPDTSIGLPQGGPNSKVDTKGTYVLNHLGLGDNLLQMIKTFLVTDPITGALGTNLATFDIVVPVLKPYANLNFKVEMQSFVIPVCNCTPWCSIGFASLDGSTTPIYFSGGANGPKGSASCGAVEVTVTRPDGSTFPLKAGTGRHQNSGANPLPGIWKVTTKVCGQEKTCQISYP